MLFITFFNTTANTTNMTGDISLTGTGISIQQSVSQIINMTGDINARGAATGFGIAFSTNADSNIVNMTG